MGHYLARDNNPPVKQLPLPPKETPMAAFSDTALWLTGFQSSEQRIPKSRLWLTLYLPPRFTSQQPGVSSLTRPRSAPPHSTPASSLEGKIYVRSALTRGEGRSGNGSENQAGLGWALFPFSFSLSPVLCLRQREDVLRLETTTGDINVSIFFLCGYSQDWPQQNSPCFWG